MKLFTYLGFILLLVANGCLEKLKGQNCSVNAGVRDTLCISTLLTLNGSVSGNFTTTPLWTILSGQSVSITNINNPITSVTGLPTPGLYLFELSLRCQDTLWARDTVSVVIFEPPAVNAGKDTLVCGNTYSAHGRFSGIGTNMTWNSFVFGGLGGAFSAPTDSVTLYSMLGATSCLGHQLVFSVNNSHCISRDTMVVTFVNSNPTNVFGDHYVCGSDFELRGNYQGCSPYQTTSWKVFGDSGFSYTWIGNLLNVTNVKKTTYTIVKTDSGVCNNDSDTGTVTVNSLIAIEPSISFAYSRCEPWDSAIIFTGFPMPDSTIRSSWAISFGCTDTFIVDSLAPNQIRLRGFKGPAVNGASCSIYVTYTATTDSCSGISTALVTLEKADTVLARIGPDTTLGCNIFSYTSPVFTTGSFSIMSSPAGSNPTIVGNTLGNLRKSGNYQFLFTKTSNCLNTSTDTLNIQVSGTPDPSNAGSNQRLICNRDSTALAGNKPVVGKGRWYLISGPNTPTMGNIDSNICTINNLIAGLYRFKWIISEGQVCTPTEDDVNVMVSVVLPVASAGADDTICYGGIVALNGNLPKSDEEGVWRQIGGEIAILRDSFSAVSLVEGLDSQGHVYTFVWSVTNGCGVATDTVLITTDSSRAPTTALAQRDTCIAAGNHTFTLKGNTPIFGSQNWFFHSGPSSAVFAPRSDTAVVNVTVGADGHYTFVYQISSAGCNQYSADTIRVSIVAPIVGISIIPNFNSCGDSVILKALVNPSNTFTTWTQDLGPPATIVSPYNDTSVIKNLNPGFYRFRIIATNGACPSMSRPVHFNVSVPAIEANAGPDEQNCDNTRTSFVTLNGSSPTPNTGTWTVLKGASTSTVADRNNRNSLYFIDTGLYRLEWYVNNGPYCPSSRDTLEIRHYSEFSGGNRRVGCTPGDTLVTLSCIYSECPGSWVQVAGTAVSINNPLLHTTTVLLNQYDHYSFVFMPSGICGCIDTVTILYDSVSFFGGYAGLDTVFCSLPVLDPIQLFGNADSASTYFWRQISGPNSVIYTPNNTVVNPMISNLSSGLYQFGLRSTNICNHIFEDTVALHIILTPDSTFAPGYVALSDCGDTAWYTSGTLHPDYIYKWHFQGANPTDTQGLALWRVRAIYPILDSAMYTYLTITYNGSPSCESKDTIVHNLACLTLPLYWSDFSVSQNNNQLDIAWNQIYAAANSIIELWGSPNNLDYHKINSKVLPLSVTDQILSFACKTPDTDFYYKLKLVSTLEVVESPILPYYKLNNTRYFLLLDNHQLKNLAPFKLDFKILDLAGKKVFQNTLISQEIIDLPLKTGSYIIEYKIGENSFYNQIFVR